MTQGLIEIGYMALGACEGDWEGLMHVGYRGYDHTETGGFDIRPV